ncbi:flagellar basal-body MS-ring/collar protein FliF [Allopusillimonas ginsengisoli]|uniref:flagellar basal-body MS-ring/collar protein FliF n=1 Tax=Allopusillimonas ginsengisoli TaxID=453575 RepID=UPI00102178D7|nr:flagellar basal-body MS-ring/collar protein FliF [Allopusillimonas ginsengisoli]TEA79394.1 flagellar basal body M-ring protein FliF [Allopusillimonas ginsengisoli]
MNPTTWVTARFPLLGKPLHWPRPIQMLLGSAALAIAIALVMWSRSPAYRVLFSNLSDRDGGTIVTALTQMNIPYQLSDTGQAILVPADKVHEARLHLAQQGLPRSGEAGFELLDKARLGSSQFAEQLTYQRALEGELANTIQALHAIQSARVHLAIPRESLFVRERQTPSASVLVTLYPGRSLTESQVNAIAWLVSSSVPRLPASEVSIVDQNGRLLTLPDSEASADATRQKLANDIEQRTVQRILTLLNPLVGPGNVRAQVSADMDFSQHEQTSETYRPNQAPDQAAIRSKQTSKSLQRNAVPPQGVPGALSNQPPPNAIAPIEIPPASSTATTLLTPPGTDNRLPALTSGTEQGIDSTNSDATINYELDRTVRHVKSPLGTLRRLSVAVVVNYRSTEDGPEPLPAEDLAKLNQLVKHAMGYSAERGDTLSVVNSQFNETVPESLPLWKNPTYIDHALGAAKYLLVLLAVYLLWQKIGQPLMENVISASIKAQEEEEKSAEPESAADKQEAAERLARELSRHEENLNTARDMAVKDPRAVAMVLRSWMENKHENG